MKAKASSHGSSQKKPFTDKQPKAIRIANDSAAETLCIIETETVLMLLLFLNI